MYTDMATNLMVENVERSIAFYRDILGFTVFDSVPGSKGGLQFAILGKDKLMLMLQERENLIGEYPILSVSKVQPSVTLYIRVDNFDCVYADIKKQYPIYKDIHTTFYGAKEFAITDPDNYVLTFTENSEN